MEVFSGFLGYISARLSRLPRRVEKGRFVQALASILGTLLFIESNLSVLMVGTLFRPLFDHFRLSREKLAYLCDSTSAPVCVLLPFNAWGAYILSILSLNGFEDPLSLLFSAMLVNWYPILTLCMVWVTIIFGFEIGPMRVVSRRAKLSYGAEEVTSFGTSSEVRPRAAK